MNTSNTVPHTSTHPAGEPAAALRRSVEELVNAGTHGLGAAAALVGGAILVALAAANGNRWQLAGAIVFSVSLFLLYLASTLYHSALDSVAKVRLKVFDHCAIYLLIAGTYTPFALVTLRGSYGWALFSTVWSLAFVGIVFKLFFTGRFKKISTVVYIAMGWLGLFVIRPLMRELDSTTLAWIVAGGVAYTAGTVFYLRSSRFSHAVWHLFCVAGSLFHFAAVARVVV